MDLKNARSRIRAAQTALQKAGDIVAFCTTMDKYSSRRNALGMAERELHQQTGRLDLVVGILREVEEDANMKQETD